MNRATQPLRDLASRLLEQAERPASSLSAKARGFSVLETLRPHLTTLMGARGYQALILRSLALAHAEAPCLRHLEVAEDGSLTGFDQLDPSLDEDTVSASCVALTAQLIGLLVAFIGKNLTLQLLSQVWPALQNTDIDFSKKIQS